MRSTDTRLPSSKVIFVAYSSELLMKASHELQITHGSSTTNRYTFRRTLSSTISAAGIFSENSFSDIPDSSWFSMVEAILPFVANLEHPKEKTTRSPRSITGDMVLRVIVMQLGTNVYLFVLLIRLVGSTNRLKANIRMTNTFISIAVTDIVSTAYLFNSQEIYHDFKVCT